MCCRGSRGKGVKGGWQNPQGLWEVWAEQLPSIKAQNVPRGIVDDGKMGNGQLLLVLLIGAPCMHRVPTLASAQSAGKILPFRALQCAEVLRPAPELTHVISTSE